MGASELARALRAGTSLKVLNLCGNGIGPHLPPALAKHPTLRTLCFESAPIPPLVTHEPWTTSTAQVRGIEEVFLPASIFDCCFKHRYGTVAEGGLSKKNFVSNMTVELVAVSRVFHASDRHGTGWTFHRFFLASHLAGKHNAWHIKRICWTRQDKSAGLLQLTWGAYVQGTGVWTIDRRARV